MKKMTNRQSIKTHIRIMASILKIEQPTGLDRMPAEEMRALFRDLRRQYEEHSQKAHAPDKQAGNASG